MKNTKFLSQLFCLFILSLSFIACGDHDNNSENQTIAEIAIETENLSSLVSALQRAELVSILESDGPFTVFAPSNASFSSFLTANGFSSLDDVPKEVLTSILLNHVVNGNYESSSLSTGYVKTNATESSSGNSIDMYINTSNGVVINGTSTVSSADIKASNGVIHIVDAVISLPSLVTFASADNSFSTLVSALTRSDLTTDFVAILNAEGPYTVFAPSNEAFGLLLDELNLNGLSDIDTQTLDAVLKYHVISGSNVLSTNLSDDMSVNTVANSEIVIDLTNGPQIVDGRNRRTNIVITDVQSSNGVIHVIDRVLLP